MDQLKKVASRTKWPIRRAVWSAAEHILTTKSTVIAQLGVTDWADVLAGVKARIGGNFKGKSLRTKDHDLLAPHVYTLRGGGYVGPPWLESLATEALQASDEPPF
jgi:hypothetical protein